MVDPLLAVLLGLGLSFGFNLTDHGVKVLGAIPDVLPMPSVPSFSYLSGGEASSFLMDASIISIIGFVETIVAAKIYANKHNYSISPNRYQASLGLLHFLLAHLSQ